MYWKVLSIELYILYLCGIKATYTPIAVVIITVAKSRNLSSEQWFGALKNKSFRSKAPLMTNTIEICECIYISWGMPTQSSPPLAHWRLILPTDTLKSLYSLYLNSSLGLSTCYLSSSEHTIRTRSAEFPRHLSLSSTLTIWNLWNTVSPRILLYIPLNVCHPLANIHTPASRVA